MKKQYIAESQLPILEIIDTLHEEHRESPIAFSRALQTEGISYDMIAHYAWRSRRQYESSQADVQIQKQLRKAGK